jgi:hypothetical protein
MRPNSCMYVKVREFSVPTSSPSRRLLVQLQSLRLKFTLSRLRRGADHSQCLHTYRDTCLLSPCIIIDWLHCRRLSRVRPFEAPLRPATVSELFTSEASRLMHERMKEKTTVFLSAELRPWYKLALLHWPFLFRMENLSRDQPLS